MKRDATGKFVTTWDSEVKRRVGVTLTNTAWQFLGEEARKQGISRSEVIERTARSFAENGGQSPETQDDQLKQRVLASSQSGCVHEQFSKSFDSKGNADSIAQICEQQLTIATLQRQKQELEVLLENAPDAIAHFDSTLQCICVNRAVEQVLVPELATNATPATVEGVTKYSRDVTQQEALHGLPLGRFGEQLENWKQSVQFDDRDRAKQDILDTVANWTDLNTLFQIVYPNGSVCFYDVLLYQSTS